MGNSMVYGDCNVEAPDEIYFVVKGECHIVRAIVLYCKTTMFGKKTYYVADHPVVKEALRVMTLPKGKSITRVLLN